MTRHHDGRQPHIAKAVIVGVTSVKHGESAMTAVLSKEWFAVSLLNYATLFDTGLLAGETTEVVKLGATYFAVFVNDD